MFLERANILQTSAIPCWHQLPAFAWIMRANRTSHQLVIGGIFVCPNQPVSCMVLNPVLDIPSPVENSRELCTCCMRTKITDFGRLLTGAGGKKELAVLS